MNAISLAFLRWLFPLAIAAALALAGAAFSQLAQAQPANGKFNHLATGFPLTGAHEKAKCESCHLKGIFKGTPRDCVQCHGTGTRISAVTIPPEHIPVTDACSVCHTTTRFNGVRFNHASAVPGNCAQCHNGTTPATVKPAGHIVTSASCDACHREIGRASCRARV